MKFLHALDRIAKWAMYPIGFGIVMNDTAGGANGGPLQQYLLGGGRRGKSDRTVAKPGSPVNGRDIFEFLYLEGFHCDPALAQSEDDYLLSDPADSDSAGSPGKKHKPLFLDILSDQIKEGLLVKRGTILSSDGSNRTSSKPATSMILVSSFVF